MGDYQIKYIEEPFTKDESCYIESIVAYLENEYNGFSDTNDDKLYL